MISTVCQYVIATVTMFDATTRCSITTVCKQEVFFVKVSKVKVKRRYHQYSLDASSSSGTDVHGRRKMA